MCGIAGYVTTDGTTSRSELTRMNEPLSHRGPDGEGYFSDGTAGFAHQRLSIIDVAGGDQPISNEDDSIHVVFNGEIYNYSSLRESLRRKHSFKTSTDTEVLLHLYEEHGLEFVEQLRGMYAFALWDQNTGRMVLSRDPIGIKPLYLCEEEGRVTFASELPSVLHSGADHGNLDDIAIGQYFAFGFVPTPRTPFQNVQKVQPGQVMTVTDGEIDEYARYTPDMDQKQQSFDEAAAELRDLLTHSVQRRLRADVPLGAFLSGGIDSSILVGLLSKLMDEPVKTFTVGFDDPRFDESRYARIVSDHWGTDHHETILSPDDLREYLPEVLRGLGEPFADPSIVPSYVVSEQTASEVKVALSGDGADELFAGYDKYLGEYYSRYYRKLPEPIRRSIAGAVDRLPASRGTRFGEVARKGQKFLRGDTEDQVERHFGWIRPSNTDTYESVNCAVESAGVTRLAGEHRRVADQYPVVSDNTLTRMRVVDTTLTLPDQMLTKMDRASMFNSLEVRVPFLDTAVVEHAFGQPSEYHMTQRGRKRLLKHACSDLLPEEILNRDKKGFDLPIGQWFKSELRSEFEETLTVDSEYVDPDVVRQMLEAHTSGDADHSKFLWSVYVFLKWTEELREQDLL